MGTVPSSLPQNHRLQQQNADGWQFILRFDIAVKVVDIHLHLPKILMRQLVALEVNEHITAQQSIVEDQINIKVVVVEGEPFCEPCQWHQKM